MAQQQQQLAAWTAWADTKARLHSTVECVIQAFMWAARAVVRAFQDDQPSRTQQTGMLVLEQLAQTQLAHALADACTCLAPPQLPADDAAASSRSASCSPAATAASKQWATLLQQAVHAAATTDCFQATLQQQCLLALPVAEAGGLDTVDRQVPYGADVILACAAAATDLVHCASTAAQRQTADVPPGSRRAGEAILQALQQSRLLDVVCGTLLRIDPTCPPVGRAADKLFPNLTGAIGHAVKAVQRALLIVEDGYADADKGSALAQSCTTRTAEAVQHLVTQPHVLQLLYAVMEAFLQEPPPSFARLLATQGTAAGGSTATARHAAGNGNTGSPAAAAGAICGTTGSPDAAAAAFLPSSLADDELSNKLLQRTWPLLAVCPLLRYMHLWTIWTMNPKGAVPSSTTSSSQAATARHIMPICQMFDQLRIIARCLWFLPFRQEGGISQFPLLPAVPAIKVHLPGLSGFCRIAVRMARWFGRAAEAMCAAALLPGTHGMARQVPWMMNMSGIDETADIACSIVFWCEVSRRAALPPCLREHLL